ncbi:MAG: transporter, partial [Planctomycetota bacterium]
HRVLRLQDPGGPDRVSEEGASDAALVVKWRYLRLDDVGIATNFALLAGLELPTGDTDLPSGSLPDRAEFQPGSGSWDPSLGAAVTHEPGRWRFNAAVLYQRNGEGTRDFKAGDELFAELAAGNRFWLEPYPGPFMRFDALLRYRHSWKARQDGDAVGDSGGDLLTVGATLAFRPRPTLDFQLFVEYPIYQSLEGTQLEEDISLFFAFGLRL